MRCWPGCSRTSWAHGRWPPPCWKTWPAPDGAPAPDLAASAGPEGWHHLAPLPAHSHRRARLLEVRPTGAGHHLQAHFRDSVAADHDEEVLHEYRIAAEADEDRRLSAIAVTPHVLPWEECPGAVASAQGVVGQRLEDLPLCTRRELTGTSTCTHLNATLRSLADAAALVDALHRSTAG